MYCTIDDLLLAIDEDRLIELTDDANSGMVNQAVVDEAIATAQGEVDGYLQERYDVPLNPVPALIKGACRDISLFHLFSRRMDELPEIRTQRYDNAVKLLTSIARGSISLGVSDHPEETNADTVRVSASDPIFSDTELDTF